MSHCILGAASIEIKGLNQLLVNILYRKGLRPINEEQIEIIFEELKTATN